MIGVTTTSVIIEQRLKRDSALQAKTLFSLLLEQYPDRYTQGQLRTFQRHVASWRALHGPEKDVIFEPPACSACSI